ncbi:MAG: hypothetical protein QOH32_3692 [Bradyrhizobium sp.]|nr:hypothetical protein [Bradyrhizobium sp.]
MSHSYSIGQPVRAATAVATGRTLLSGWINNAVSWLERRRQWRHLRELDDRLLADVGISPEQAFHKAGRPLQAISLVALEPATGPGQRS